MFNKDSQPPQPPPFDGSTRYRSRRSDPRMSGQLCPDTEENVAAQTDDVFRNFVFHMYTSARVWNDGDVLEDYPTQELLFTNSTTSIEEIGRQLALIGDDINERYASHFQQMIKTMNLTPETAYEAFAGVARRLFRGSNVSWGRVVTLLCFGYRMAMSVIRKGITGFFSNVVVFVSRFIISERIAKWIADQGGWRAVLNYVPESASWTTLAMIVGIAAISCLTVLYVTRRQ